MKRSPDGLHVFLPKIWAKKMVGHFRLIWKILPSSNGCRLTKNGYRFAKLRKYLCFCFFIQQRKIFSSIKRTFSPKQTQNVPKKDSKKRLLQFYLFEVSSWQYSTISDKVVVPVGIASQFFFKKIQTVFNVYKKFFWSCNHFFFPTSPFPAVK